jgi:hypothetical protein
MNDKPINLQYSYKFPFDNSNRTIEISQNLNHKRLSKNNLIQKLKENQISFDDTLI